MPLNFDVSKVRDFNHVCTSPQSRGLPMEEWHPLTNSLVTLSMICGYSQITAANSKEIAQRIAAYQKITGPCLRNKDCDIYITEADVVQHIGLCTNASTMSKAKWNAHLVRIINREAELIMTGRSNTINGPLEVILNEGAMSAYDKCEKLHKHYAATKEASNVSK